MHACPECEKPLTTPLVCMECNALLPQAPGQAPSPFGTLGLEESWQVDNKALKKRLLRFSRAVHPDFFATEDEATRSRAEDASAALNSAFEILKDDFKRADWLVNRLGGPAESEEREMPQVFLMQVMDWNEVLEDTEGAEADSTQWKAMETLGSELKIERADRLLSVAQHLEPLPPQGAPQLTEARRELNAVRYIDRTQKEIKRLKLQASLGPRS